MNLIARRRKETIKVRAEIENRKAMDKVCKSTSLPSENIKSILGTSTTDIETERKDSNY